MEKMSIVDYERVSIYVDVGVCLCPAVGSIRCTPADGGGIIIVCLVSALIASQEIVRE